MLLLAGEGSLTSESVEGTSLALQSIDHIHGSHGLPLGMLSVGDSIPDDILQEHLQDTSGLFVNQPRDTLHTTPSCQTADGRLGDALDVISQHLSVTLGASFSQSLSSFATSRHDDSSNTRFDLRTLLLKPPLYRGISCILMSSQTALTLAE